MGTCFRLECKKIYNKNNWTTYRGAAGALAQDHPILLLLWHCCLEAFAGIFCQYHDPVRQLVSQWATSILGRKYGNKSCLKKLPMHHSLVSPQEHTRPYLDQCQMVGLGSACCAWHPVLKCRSDWNFVGTVTLRCGNSADRAVVIMLTSSLHKAHVHKAWNIQVLM